MNQTAYIVTGLAFGDEGKGGTVDFLASVNPGSTVIRHNGGAQAGHNVISGDGRHHTFAQWGSATFHGCRTFLSRYMAIHPTAMIRESEVLSSKGVRDPFSLLDVSMGALVITPLHQAMNRTRELARGEDRHGTCGMGFGESVSMSYTNPEAAIRVVDLHTPDTLSRKLRLQMDLANAFAVEMGFESVRFDPEAYKDRMAGFLRNLHTVDETSYMKNLVASGKPLIFEGAQGVLLDKWHGFHPHTTWSDTTPRNAMRLLNEVDFSGNTHVIGCLRTYMTRHGEGPFPTEASLNNPEYHNSPAGWQGPFRQGHFDAVLFRYSLEAIGGVDSIALSHLDAVKNTWKYVDAYRPDFPGLVASPTPADDMLYQDSNTALLRTARPEIETMIASGDFLDPYSVVDKVSAMLGSKVGIASFGARSTDKINLAVPVCYSNIQRRKVT